MRLFSFQAKIRTNQNVTQLFIMRIIMHLSHASMLMMLTIAQ